MVLCQWPSLFYIRNTEENVLVCQPNLLPTWTLFMLSGAVSQLDLAALSNFDSSLCLNTEHSLDMPNKSAFSQHALSTCQRGIDQLSHYIEFTLTKPLNMWSCITGNWTSYCCYMTFNRSGAFITKISELLIGIEYGGERRRRKREMRGMF